MTDKQRKILEKYITNDRIKILDGLGFKYVSGFINLIMNTANQYYNFCCINILNEAECEKNEKAKIEEFINTNKAKYTKISDEYCYMNKVYIIPEYDKRIYKLRQTWFKGMSNIPTSHNFSITEGGELFGTYNALIDMKIYNILSFMDYLRRNKFDKEKEN